MTTAKAQREAAKKLTRQEKLEDRRKRHEQAARDKEANAGGFNQEPIAVKPAVSPAASNIHQTLASSQPVAVAAAPSKTDTESKCWWERVKVVGPEKAPGVPINSVIYVNPNRVFCLPQTRTQFDEQSISDLAETIMEDEQEEPVHLVHLAGDPDHDWLLMNGERRLRACQLAGLPVFALVKKKPASDKEWLVGQAISNINREELSPADTANTIDQMERFGMSLEAIGRIMHYGVATVKKYLVIARELHPEVKRRMTSEVPEKERIGPDVAAEIAKFETVYQPKIAEEVVGKTINAARLHIRNISGKTDQESGREPKGDYLKFRPRTPWDDRRIWKTFFRRVADWLAHHGEQKPEFYQKLLAGCSEEDFVLLLTQLGRAVNNLQVIERLLNEAKPKHWAGNGGQKSE